MTSSSASSLDNPNRRLTVGGGMRHACHASSIARRSVPGSRSGRKACERLRRRAPERLAIVVARFLAKTYDRRKGRHESLLHGGVEWRVDALRRYPSSDADEFGLPELAHSVERFDRDGNLGRASGVVA